MRRIYCKYYSKWTDDIQTQLRKNTFGNLGLMIGVIRTKNPMTYVMLDAKKVIGWALVDETSQSNNFAMFFIPKKNRRQGIGTKIAKRIKKDYHSFYVEPWNTSSQKFFDSVKMIIS